MTYGRRVFGADQAPGDGGSLVSSRIMQQRNLSWRLCQGDGRHVSPDATNPDFADQLCIARGLSVPAPKAHSPALSMAQLPDVKSMTPYARSLCLETCGLVSRL